MKVLSIPEEWLATLAQDHHLWLYARDETRNINRFYHLAFEATLFSEHTVIIQYGRYRTYGQRKTYSADTREEGMTLITKALKRRLSSHKRIGISYQQM